MKAELGAGCEHAIRLVGTFGDEIVNEDSAVSFVALEDERFEVGEFTSGVYASEQALNAGFFVAGSSVDLAGEEKAVDGFDFEAMIELAGIDCVVFNRVTRANHFGIFEAFDGSEHCRLDVNWHACRHAVDVDLVCVETFGFEEDLVAILVGKLDYFVFYGRTVAGADAFDLAAVKRTAGDGFLKNCLRAFIGVGEEALDLGAGDAVSEEGEGSGDGVAVLNFEFGKVDGAGVEAGRGACLEAGPLEVEGAERVAEEVGGGFAVAAAGVAGFANVGDALQEGAGGDDDGTGENLATVGQFDTLDLSPFVLLCNEELGDFGLEDAEVGFLLEDLLHADAVELFVALSAGAPDGGAAGGIEETELDADVISDFAHQSAEGIDLADEVAFGDAANGRVAGHLRNEVGIHGDDAGLKAHSGTGARGFATGVTGADDEHVVSSLFQRKLHGEGAYRLF